MQDGGDYAETASTALDVPVHSEHHFIASEILARDDVAERRAKLAQIVSAQIVPRLMSLLEDGKIAVDSVAVRPEEIIALAHIVLDPDLNTAVAFATRLKDRGLPAEALFVDLLEPAARHLGRMWDSDECDFIDVTLGVGRLQKLLSVFNGTHAIPAIGEKRTVFMATTPDEQHSFGLAMVDKFLLAGGWRVSTLVGASDAALGKAVEENWFAVAGLTVSSDGNLENVAAAIRTIRARSANPAIGVMVGGALFIERPELVAQLGADATALNAPAAVIVAQRLFDEGALTNWSAAPR
jgi:methanogenic corrinoid protein MtbC1